jgi:hypothetical protein
VKLTISLCFIAFYSLSFTACGQSTNTTKPKPVTYLVFITDRTDQTHQGLLRMIDHSHIELADKKDSAKVTSYYRQGIKEIKIRKSKAVRNGARNGFLIATATFCLVGFTAQVYSPGSGGDNYSSPDPLGVLVVGTVMGAAVGTPIGALVGSSSKKFLIEGNLIKYDSAYNDIRNIVSKNQQ